MRLSQDPGDAGQKPISVLAVDDDPSIRVLFDGLFAKCGYDGCTASNGKEALAILQERRYDVCLCDVMMPGMSGEQVLSEAIKLQNDIAVIMMSGRADTDLARQLLGNGAVDFLEKPFSLLSTVVAIEGSLRRAETQNIKILEQTNRILLESIKAFSSAIEAKEHGTAEHSKRIVALALQVADVMGLSTKERTSLEMAGYMHDIGKIGIPLEILLKPGKLSAKEWKSMKKHPDIGYKILSNLEEFGEIAKVVRHHHERLDGAGYPDGLSGEDIPLLSRILAVADSFDAMISDRAYRPGMSHEEACRRLLRGAGTQFDPGIVRVLVGIVSRQMLRAA